MENNNGNIFNESLEELQNEYIKIEDDINTIERKKEQLNKLKKEINLQQEQLKKSAFDALLSKFDKVLELYPEHKFDDRVINALNNEKAIEIALKIKPCTDLNPSNITICERCAILYLQKYMETQMANFYIM